MGVTKGLLFVAILSALIACKAEKNNLEHLFPDVFIEADLQSQKTRLLNCKSQTYRAKLVDDHIVESWDEIERPFSSSFLKCLSAAEIKVWTERMKTGTVLWHILEGPKEIHVWYSSKDDVVLLLWLNT